MKTVTLNGVEVTYSELENLFNLPKDVTIEGCHTYSNNNQDVEFLKVVEGIKAFPVFGFGHELTKLIAEDEVIQNDIYRIFDKSYLTINKLVELGFGATQAVNYFTGLHKTYSKGIPFNLIIKSLNINGCGNTITEQFTRYYYDMKFEVFGLTKDVWNQLISKDMSRQISTIISDLEDAYGYKVIHGIETVEEGAIKVVMTGSPKKFNFKTKAEFLKTYPNIIEIKKIQDADFLITDNLESTSSKMKAAHKFNVKIKTYDQF